MLRSTIADARGSRSRRRWLAWAAGARVPGAARAGGETGATRSTAMRLCTFGDSVLDCGRYNARGLDPGQLLVANDDVLFPEFRGRDLRSRGGGRLEHRAVDGAVAADLMAQARGLAHVEGSVALVTV